MSESAKGVVRSGTWDNVQAGMIRLTRFDPDTGDCTDRWIDPSEIKQIEATLHGYRVLWGYNHRALFAVIETCEEILKLKDLARK